MKNKGIKVLIITLCGLLVMLFVVVLLIQLPSITAIKPIKEELPLKETNYIETSETYIEETTVVEIESPVVTANIMNFSGYSDNISIDYPELEGMEDEDLQDKINNKIKANALSIIELYPISTSLQKLNISCEVKSLTEDYLTILYSGSVVGISVKNASSTRDNTVSYETKSNNNYRSSSSSGSSNSNLNAYDPYLNGFVDPLANRNQYVVPTTSAPVGNMGTPIVDALPLPKGQNNSNSSSTRVFTNETIETFAAPKQNSSSGRVMTEDKGPVAKSVTAPTAKSKSMINDGNVSSNNPTGKNTSSGVVYSGSANSSNGPVSSQNAPVNNSPVIDMNAINEGAPIYAYSGSNNSASTIDQRIFYTNTIDLKSGNDVTLKDYVMDLNALAKYTRSSKVQFVNVDDSNRSAVREYINKTVLLTMTEHMKEADFRNIELKTWPKHFSYRDEDGTIYFTVKLSSKLGNYAIVKYIKKIKKLKNSIDFRRKK